MRAPDDGPAFVELGAASCFSFLRGASWAHEMVGQAWELGHAAAAVADRNTVAGVVRAHVAAKEMRTTLDLPEGAAAPPAFRLCVGARLAFCDGTPDVLAYPSDRESWGRLTALLTRAGMEAGADKGDAQVTLEALEAQARGLNLILAPCERPDADGVRAVLDRLLAASGGRAWLAGVRRFDAVDAERLDLMADLAAESGAPLLAMTEALTHHPSRQRLQDVMTCIREKTTLAEAGRRLQLNAERTLKPGREMARLFRDHPDAVPETARFAALCDFSLDELAYEYPSEPVPKGRTAQGHLEHLAWKGARWRYPKDKHPRLPKVIVDGLKAEFALIAKHRYANYFLTVHDIVKWARDRGILCQGRGSAANSITCFCLGITAVDPVTEGSCLLFERFISDERDEPPDIDVDFEHERREDVIQHIYERYGRHRAAICATVIHYRPRMAIREVGKVFGLDEDVAASLASTIWGSWGDALPDDYVRQAGEDPDNAELREALEMANQLIGFPRHLSQHVGGFVLTEGPLSRTCAIVNGAMPDRTFIEWDKDDIDALGLMKVDVLALGMLTAIQKAVAMLQQQGALPSGFDMADTPQGQPDVYKMCAAGDTVGVFQIESRAQMNMLPRLRPEKFYDLVVEVAIVRPGPIQGEMVHPYLRRKTGLEKVEYPSPAPPHDPDELKKLLDKTLGVPLFQEQVMKVAMVAAEFTGSEADGLRRAMATFKRTGGMGGYHKKLVEGMTRRGYTPEFAESIFKQIEGFGSYGFPESHAASFAKLVYVSAWLKERFPAVFCAAILNSQPMGFYAPAQLVRDAREHGVEVRPVDVEHSRWDCGIETAEDGAMAVRLGFRVVDGLSQTWVDRIAERRGEGYGDFDAFVRRTGFTRAQMTRLAQADAFRSLGAGRRGSLWQALMVDRKAPAPLLADLPRHLPAPDLPLLSASEEVVADYRTTRLSLRGHPMQFLRERFQAAGVAPCEALARLPDKATVSVAGVVLVRQRPGNGQVCFITVEDEGAVANLVVVMPVFEAHRGIIMSSRLLVAHGRIQKSPEGVTHVFVERLEDRSDLLSLLSDPDEPGFQPAIARADHVLTNGPTGSAGVKLTSLSPAPLREPDRARQARPPGLANSHRHPRDVRIVSRDFH
ncbi:MAG: error-prone DNA polymerase [Caulobacteraceae bacterium]|nr:error-prone DNA polymerase [Caulobacter sp.]